MFDEQVVIFAKLNSFTFCPIVRDTCFTLISLCSSAEAEYGPATVTSGYLILDSSQLTLSWGREDPVTFAPADILHLALIYGPTELPEFIPQLDRMERAETSTGHR